MGMTEDEMAGWHYRLNGHGFGENKASMGDLSGGPVLKTAHPLQGRRLDPWLVN